MNVELRAVQYDEKEILRNLLELYMYELSPYLENVELNKYGLFGYRYLDHYWTEEGRFPFFIYASDKLAGFAMIRKFDVQSENEFKWLMAEFFVIRKFQKQGIGRIAAMQAFNRFPGTWIVAQIENNIPSRLFWEKVISEYTNGAYIQTKLGKQPAQEFVSPGGRNHRDKH